MNKSGDDGFEGIPSGVGSEEKESGNGNAQGQTTFDDGSAYCRFSCTRRAVEPQDPMYSNRRLYHDPGHDIIQDHLTRID